MTLTPVRPAPETWPGLDAVPAGLHTTVSAHVARKLFLAAVRRLPVTVDLDGEVHGLGGPSMTVHRPDEFFARLGRDKLIGFGEGYLTGAWDSDELAGFLTVLAADVADLVPRSLQTLRGLVVARPPRLHRNSKRRTRDNIAHHYDLSNDLFSLFLDPSLSYSSALFEGNPSGDLHAAQLRKIDRLLDETHVGPGTRVLEIGTGWGELAIRAAARGATVHSVTLSTEQQALARQRIEAAGFSDRVHVELADYRDVAGEYDAVLSVEMIEAVGHEYWPTYFRTIDRVLAPGGRVGIQAILMPHDRMLATRRTYTWINKYIFPGGFLPSAQVIDEVNEQHTSLRVTNRLAFGADYAETLQRWDTAFLAAADRVKQLGFDETFLRMWHFYLEYSRAGFASGYLDVQQLTLTRET
ncbi:MULTISPECIES: SAM-dependent methyltransferase [unclassified Nocardioides]|uniref:SAM-dependent methyltransferase n=1 Tax=unclassified Nocardioides TaxID=2615069 RepID=UPI0009F01FCA|nr:MULTISPECIES: cyclopropane-fatty-acyl-phospholipid synthase family protein [unclassified Nocardioides]GAW51928.1 cyclopropane-fatty-acyl-phospholipid synthase [Nocardioides sp. PD653-B2]GAW56466.1 cyclopropane-fatty-acyl-phospholipid synthase [Nocardioides sp. PD653]